MVPRGLEPRTLRLLAVRSNQLSYETSARLVSASMLLSLWSRPRKAGRCCEQAGHSSVGRASDCRALQQSDGPWFDSGWPDGMTGPWLGPARPNLTQLRCPLRTLAPRASRREKSRRRGPRPPLQRSASLQRRAPPRPPRACELAWSQRLPPAARQGLAKLMGRACASAWMSSALSERAGWASSPLKPARACSFLVGTRAEHYRGHSGGVSAIPAKLTGRSGGSFPALGQELRRSTAGAHPRRAPLAPQPALRCLTYRASEVCSSKPPFAVEFHWRSAVPRGLPPGNYQRRGGQHGHTGI